MYNNSILIKKFLAVFLFITCFLNCFSIVFANEYEKNIDKFKSNYEVVSCRELYCILKEDNKYAIANPLDGKLLTYFEFDEIIPLNPVLALKVRKNKQYSKPKYGIYDLNKKRISKIEYDDIRLNQKNGKYFFEYNYKDKWRKLRGVRLKKVVNVTKNTAITVVTVPYLIITAPVWILFGYGLYKEFNP